MKKNIIFIKILVFLTLTIIVVSGCTSISFGTTNMDDSESEKNEKTKNQNSLSLIQQKLVLAAEYFNGNNNKNINVEDKTYVLDCSGAILAIYYKSGIILEKCYSNYSGNGVKRIYSCLKDNNLLYYSKDPEPGDLIFWDNTYDKNEDGKFNDYLTHIGMVVMVDSKGTITYIHHNYRKGMVYEKMNLYQPDNREVNSPMRMKTAPSGPNGESLSGELIKTFGQAWLLPKSYYR